MIKRLIFLYGFAFLFTAAAGQEKRGISHLGVDDGLSQGSVFDMVQDEPGFIWATSSDGLNRFDGYRFQVFKNDPADSLSFHNTRLRNLFRSKNVLWITSTGNMELYRMDLLTQKISRIYSFSSPVNGFGDILPFKESGDTLWMLVTGKGVVALDVKRGKVVREFPEAVDAYPANNIVSFDAAANRLWYLDAALKNLCSFSLSTKQFNRRSFTKPGTSEIFPLISMTAGTGHTIRIGTDQGILSFDPATGNYRYYPLDNKGGAEQVGALLAANGEDLWCGTEQGAVYLFSEKNKTFTRRLEPARTGTGMAYRVIKFLPDKTGNLWIGTDPDGIYRLDTKQKAFHHILNDPASPNSLRSNFIKCFLEKGNELFTGTYDKGIAVSDSSGRCTRYINGFDPSAAHCPAIHSMTADASGTIWVCTDEGIGLVEEKSGTLGRPRLTEKNERLYERAMAICPLAGGALLVAGHRGVYLLTPGGNGYRLVTTAVDAIGEKFFTDRQGGLWMCSPKGLYYSAKSIPQELKLVTEAIGHAKCILQDSKGVIWVGSHKGLHRFAPGTQRIEKSYTEKDGMPNAFVYGILEDAQGRLWISTNKGIAKFDPEQERFRSYTVTDGLQSNEFNTGAYYKTASGEFLFGGVNGFNRFFPSAIKDNPFAPACSITGLKIFDKPLASDSIIAYRKQVVLGYSDNNLLLEYTALEFSDPAKNRFRYRLLGLDSNWIDAGQERFARFINLGPGDYIFQVKAANNDGLWNPQPKELRITITPPVWKTLPFILSMIALGLLTAFLAIRFYLRRQLAVRTREFRLSQSVRMNAIIETEEKERKRVAEELHDGLGQLLSTARLTLSGFEPKAGEKDARLLHNSLQLLDEACAEVRHISHNMMPGALIRQGLIEAVNELANRINDTEKIKVHYETSVEERFPEAVEIALYRIIQEILNNMLKHAEAKNIRLLIEKQENEIRVSLSDDGKSFDVSRIPGSEGIGWKNIYSRVEILNGSIRIESEKEKGTSVFLSVPLS